MCPERARDLALRAEVDVTQLFSLRENAIVKEPGRAILSLGGVCLDSGW
jgi:hypothetical protein